MVVGNINFVHKLGYSEVSESIIIYKKQIKEINFKTYNL